MRKIDVKIEGITPLLMNKFNIEDISGESKKFVGMKNVTDDEVERKVYRNSKGQIFFPSKWFEGCLIAAGKSFKIPQKGKATYSKIIGSGISVEPLEIVNATQKYEIDVQVARNANTGGRIVCKRPRFDSWGATFQIVVDEEQLSLEVIKRLLEHAGQYVGVGNWRPSLKGKYGKFKVTCFKEAA